MASHHLKNGQDLLDVHFTYKLNLYGQTKEKKVSILNILKQNADREEKLFLINMVLTNVKYVDPLA